jgi:hypothetical protein
LSSRFFPSSVRSFLMHLWLYAEHRLVVAVLVVLEVHCRWEKRGKS